MREQKALQPCTWAQGDDYLQYHNEEWGIPCFDRQRLFEKLCLEGQQAGLSWITVLRKRAHYRDCFYQFDIERVARMSDDELNELVLDAGLIRHIGKLTAIRTNAVAWLAAESSGINMVTWLWAFVGGRPEIHRYPTMEDVPTSTESSQQMSKALKKRGFSFVGPTICYAFQQSMGMVNDHLTNCPCHPDNQCD